MSDPVSTTGAELSAPAEMCATCASSGSNPPGVLSTSAVPLAAFIPAQRSRAPRIDVSIFHADRASYGLRRRDAVDVLSGMFAGARQGAPDRPRLLSGEA
ncbi:hypothetical protein ABH940_003721 [Streptacidiphilus sp. BW17]|uniref:hypothetical protein n=1 Tax=Streptacidiphilus sp. BW17 TaxID=3156274 RepID=UPI00351109B0